MNFKSLSTLGAAGNFYVRYNVGYDVIPSSDLPSTYGGYGFYITASMVDSSGASRNVEIYMAVKNDKTHGVIYRLNNSFWNELTSTKLT